MSTWAQEPDNSTQPQIFAQVMEIGTDFIPAGYSSRLDAPVGGGARVYPAIASGKRPTVVVWEQVRDGSGYTDIYGRIIYTYGVFLPVAIK